MKQKVVVSLAAVLVLFNVAFGQKQTVLSGNQIKVLDSIACQDVPKAAPGIATAIISNGAIIYQKVAGFANLKDSTLITPTTRFNCASNGKQFTALAILVLENENKIKLTDDLRTYLPTLFPQYPHPITIEQLLNHSSGIRDVYDLWSLQGITWWEKSFDNSDALHLLEKQKELNFKPGTQYAYSNSNYILLAKIIEKITGQSFVHYTKSLFNKLNMPNTSFEDNYRNIKEPIARAYFNFSTWKTYQWIWNVCGDGNLFTTLEDQIQWEIAVQKRNNPFIKPEIIEKSQKLVENTALKNYGYGLEFGNYKGIAYKFHEGATGAWKATTLRFSDPDVALITLTNTGKATPNNQTRQMADVVLHLKEDANYFETKPTKIGELITDTELLGIYATEANFTFQFVKKENDIYLKRVGRNDVLLERESANVFHQTYDENFKQEFTKNAKGALEVTAYYTSHAPYKLTKLTADFTNFNFYAIEGTFINEETKATIEIKYIDQMNYQVKIGKQKDLTGILLSPGQLLVENYVLNFGSGDPIKTILLNADRIKNVTFQRKK